MARRLASISAVVAVGLSGLGASAEASPLTYDLVSNGQSQFVITATITNAQLGLNNAPITIDGGSNAVLSITSGTETIDSSVPALDSFDFVSNGTGSTSNTGSYTLVANGQTLGTVVLSNVTLSGNSAIGLTGSGTTSNPYAFSTTSATDSAAYNFTSAGGTKSSGMLSQPGQSFAGSIVTASNGSTNFEQTSGIELGQFSFGSSTVELWVGNNAMATGTTGTVKDDVTFDGQTAVPLPAGIWLLMSGLGGLGLMRRRSPAAAFKG